MAIKRAIKAGNKSIISFKKVIKVGEITQLVAKDNFLFSSVVTSGVTFTNNGNGSITAVGTTTALIARLILSHTKLERLKNGHKYLISSGQDDNTNNYVAINFYDDNQKNLGSYSSFSSPIFTFDGIYYASNIGGIYIYERITGAEINRTYIPQLFDLTEMFGAGHEPATVDEFKARFPEAYYPYQRAVLNVYNKVVRPCVRKGEVVQLVNPVDFGFTTQTVNGITFTNNNDGSVTINGTATSDAAYRLILNRDKIINGYVYLYGSEQNTNDYGVAWGTNLPQNLTFNTASINSNYTVIVKNGATVNNITIFPQIYNLTAMYGAGNEPKTLADFRKDYPESYYPYSPIQTKNLFDIRKVSGLISSLFGNLNYYLTKNLTQNSLKIRYGGYGMATFLKEPYILSAGTYTFSCNCDYDVINNRGGVSLFVGKKAADGSRINEIASGPYRQVHRLVLTFTLAEETEVYLSLQGDGGSANYTNLNNVFFNIQLEKGSVATDYVPHDYI
jgi:hypothetical protein